MARVIQTRSRAKLREIFEGVSNSANAVGSVAGIVDAVTVGVISRVVGAASVATDTASNIGVVGFQTAQGVVDKVILGNV